MTAQHNARRVRLIVTGIVQGVGFRPHVYRLASDAGLSGWVENDPAGVVIEVEGTDDGVEAFMGRLEPEAPPLARIDAVNAVEIGPLATAADGFVVRPSRSVGTSTASISPDVATCSDCLREVRDPTDRRYRYPFVNCTNCGPRYSIVTSIPYDRERTTMAGFPMCGPCAAEYHDPADRRFHAQPLCCPDCGPTLDISIDATVEAIAAGRIVALKGLGGYHLVALADHDDAVARLRARKRREDKPFALMAPDLDAVERLCSLEPGEREVLTSIERPIVLLNRRPDAPVADAVAPRGRELGVMLPYTPLHHLLLDALGEPIVCTSANLSDEPIAYTDDDARRRLATVADEFVTHDRPIHTRVEDSVMRVVQGRPYPIRRSRGYAPAPIAVAGAAPRPILACGAELKNTITYARGRDVYLSPHIGDLKSYETECSFVEAIGHLGSVLEIRPELVVSDLHPEYRSTRYAAERDDLRQVRVQHHHAHVAACIADAGHDGSVIGVAFDGIGYGDDGTIWGGEFLVADAASYRRAGWFEPVPMPGGDAATRSPWRMAVPYLDAIGQAAADDLDVISRHDDWVRVRQIAASGVNSPLTSSVGRLFDAAASLIGIRDEINYEGQAAIEFEQIADTDERLGYPAAVRSGADSHVVVGSELIAHLVSDLRAGTAPATMAMRFHRGVVDAVGEVCGRIRAESGIDTVALTGGVFLNRILVNGAIERLEADGFEVLRHERVPCNDGGISFGQAVIAAAQDRAGLLD